MTISRFLRKKKGVIKRSPQTHTQCSIKRMAGTQLPAAHTQTLNLLGNWVEIPHTRSVYSHK